MFLDVVFFLQILEHFSSTPTLPPTPTPFGIRSGVKGQR